jgi:hypothetical protein
MAAPGHFRPIELASWSALAQWRRGRGKTGGSGCLEAVIPDMIRRDPIAILWRLGLRRIGALWVLVKELYKIILLFLGSEPTRNVAD